MRFVPRALMLVLLTPLLAAPGFADGSLVERSQVKLGGSLAFVNRFGGKATHEGLETTQVLKGNRLSSVTGDNAQVIDLDEEVIYQVDLKKGRYEKITFEQMRQQMQQARESLAQLGGGEGQPQDQRGPEYTFDVDVQKLGPAGKVNGFDSQHVRVVVTVHQVGKSLEQGGGSVLTSDMMLTGPQQLLLDIQDFQRRFVQKLDLLGGLDNQLGFALASFPQMQKAMKELEKAAIEGSPVHTQLTFESVPDPNAPRQEQAGAPSFGSVLRGVGLGGKKKDADQGQGGGGGADGGGGRTMVFQSTIDVLRISGDTSGEPDLSGFKLKK